MISRLFFFLADLNVVFRICDSDFTGGCHRHSMIDPMVEALKVGY